MRNHGRLGSADPDELTLALLAHLQGALLSERTSPFTIRTTMTALTSGAPGTPILPDYVPVPRAPLGPAVHDQGYYVRRVERNLYVPRRSA